MISLSARVPRAAWYLGGAYVVLVMLVAADLHVSLDRAVATWLYTEPSCWARVASAQASVVFAGEVCLAYAFAIGAYCTWRGRPFVGAWVVVILLATVGLELVFKYYFVQPAPSAFLGTLTRPPCETAGPAYPLTVVPTPSSLPSGYATRATFFGVLLAALVGGRWPRLGWLAWPLLVGMSLTLAASRVTVGWHWPSDVVAGVFLGGTAGLLVIGAADWFRWLRPTGG
ncbi:MAG: phosphatase PAP2 family protein, partial [Chloroflexota bacterium]|nr:phosphatase PAP2 family protein [Chloroflexota bacterium]